MAAFRRKWHERALRALKWLIHPVVVFVGLQVIWLAITLMWVIWFADSFQRITKLAKVVGTPYLDNDYALVVLVVGCVLLGILLVGTVFLFVISQRQNHLMVQQKSFVSSVTHELRSPLASLQLTFETLQKRQLDEQTVEKLLGMAMEDIERLTRLVNHILVSSRLDRGISGFSEEPQSLHLPQLISQLALKAQWLDPDLGSRLEVICPEGLRVHAPKPVMALIISNLLENAIKYSPKGTAIKIMVNCTQGQVTLAVMDQGFGLAPSEKKRIFRMFHRSPVALKKAVPGTGLGLFIVKSLARSMEGRAWVESPGKDKGSTFYVAFPLHSPDVGRS